MQVRGGGGLNRLRHGIWTLPLFPLWGFWPQILLQTEAKGYFIQILLFSISEGTEFSQNFANKKKIHMPHLCSYSAPPPPTPPLVRPNIYTCIRRQELKGLRSEGVIALYPLRFSPSPLSQKRLILSRRLAITQTV